MRRRGEVAGLPVVVIDSGKTVGRVKDVVFDLDHGRLRGLLVVWKGGEAFLPFDQVHNLGPQAVTVGAETVMLPADARGGAEDPAASRPWALGKRVLTREGQVLGFVDDVIFDPESGAVWGYQVTAGFIADFVDGKKALPLTDEMVVGPDAVVVSGEDVLQGSGDGWGGAGE